MPNLYEINHQIQQLFDNCIDPETGEMLDVLVGEKINEIQMEEQDKIENIALFIKELESDVEAIRTEESSLKQRRISKEKKSDWLNKYLSDYLILTERPKFETSKCALSFRKSESVDIYDERAIDHKFITEETVFKIDKTAIKKAIKNGEEIMGASVVVKQNLQIK